MSPRDDIQDAFISALNKTKDEDILPMVCGMAISIFKDDGYPRLSKCIEERVQDCPVSEESVDTLQAVIDEMPGDDDCPDAIEWEAP